MSEKADQIVVQDTSKTVWEMSLPEIAREAANHGHAVVPVEPTIGMLESPKFYDGTPADRGAIGHVYRAMIAAGRVKPE